MSGAVPWVRKWSFERAAARGLPPGASPRPSLELELARIASVGKEGQFREFFSKDWRQVFFINAHPRSGTNWLGALMNLHWDVTCTGEFTFHELFNAAQALTTLPGRAAAREPMRTIVLTHFAQTVRQCVMSSPGQYHGRHGEGGMTTRFGDHTPRRLRILLPDASYIVLFRDGRDVLVSWTYNALARKEHWVVPAPIRTLFDQQLDRFTSATLANDTPGQHAAAGAMLSNEVWVRHVARQWAAHVRDDLDGIARIKSGELPGQVLALRYEDLHADTDGVRAEAYRFLGVDPRQAAPLEQGSNTLPGFVGRAATGHDATPARAEDPRSHYRRGQVGDWREKLTTQAVGWIEAEAGTELAFLGY